MLNTAAAPAMAPQAGGWGCGSRPVVVAGVGGSTTPDLKMAATSLPALSSAESG